MVLSHLSLMLTLFLSMMPSPLIISDVAAQPEPQSEEATNTGKTSIGIWFELGIALPVAAIAIIAVWKLQKKRLIF